MKFVFLFLSLLLGGISQSCSHSGKDVESDISDDAIAVMKNLREGDVVNGVLADVSLNVITDIIGVTMGKGATSNPTFTISDPNNDYNFILLFQVSGGEYINIYDIKYILRGLDSRSVYTISFMKILK